MLSWLMRMWKRSLTALVFLFPLLAEDAPSPLVSPTQTARFDVKEAGTVHVENSFGEVNIQGWDRPQVEVRITRSTEHAYSAHDRAAAQQRLDSVQVNTKQDGNDLVITTVYPARSVFLHPLSRRSDIEIHYEINAPRASKLIIDHNNGGINIAGMHGAVHATVINGQITLLLPPGPYAIDAQSHIGNIYSDFAGSSHSHCLIGQTFTGEAPASAINLYLRARLGDIMLLKPSGPAD
jgi:hypothetical protein